ncbi:hypothetical protein QBC44DRAFT_403918 [Cladorrhinum sp. PSN332]|nr:hypothetical protein QBC44DRAFT_403918 [Cladorrhinum sp. PSN332]
MSLPATMHSQNRQVLEGLQVVHDYQDGYGLHPMASSSQALPYTSLAFKPSPEDHEEHSAKKQRQTVQLPIFGWRARRTTLALVITNILLGVALIILGTVQSHVLKDNSNSNVNTTAPSSAGSESQCPQPEPKPSETVTPTVCFNSSLDQNLRGKSECPYSTGDPRAFYTVPGTQFRFERICGKDYNGNDMGSVPTATMLDCIALCAYTRMHNLSVVGLQGTCMAVAWNYGAGRGDQIGLCFLKFRANRLDEAPGLESAVLMP